MVHIPLVANRHRPNHHYLVPCPCAYPHGQCRPAFVRAHNATKPTIYARQYAEVYEFIYCLL